jgi:hypothetical protein
MEPNRVPDVAARVDRRAVIGLGVASGLALASLPTADVFGKTREEVPEKDPQLSAAFFVAVKRDVRYSTNGCYAVLYPENQFAGDPVVIGQPRLITKFDSGTVPNGWGAKAGSIVVGQGAVLRLIHKVNGQDVHVTLLPSESMAEVSTLGIADGVASWKLYPANKLRPPY